MRRSRNVRSVALAAAMSLLLLLLPTASTLAQQSGSDDRLLDASQDVRFNTRSGDPASILYLGDDRSSPDLWSLESRRTGEDSSYAGSFQPAHRVSLEGMASSEALELLKARGVQQFDNELVVGTHFHPDGREELVAAIRFDYIFENGVEHFSAMTPMFTGYSLEALRITATELADAMISGMAPDRLGFEEFDSVPGKSTCEHYCNQDFEFDMSHCGGIFAAQMAAAAAAGTLCVIACPASGPLVAICLAACVTAVLAAEAAALLNVRKCTRDARRAKARCLQACGPPPV